MKTQETNTPTPGLPHETSIHKVFVFILKKLDVIYSSLSNDQTLMQKHKLMLYDKEQSLFFEIQKLLDKLINISKKQSSEQKQQSLPRLDNVDDIMKSNLAKSHLIESSMNPSDVGIYNDLSNHIFMQSAYPDRNFDNPLIEQVPQIIQPEQRTQHRTLQKHKATMYVRCGVL